MSSSYDKDYCPNCGRTDWDSFHYYGRDNEERKDDDDDEDN